ncbi:MAG: alginate lyase family protein [Acidimicrobiales bacterium]
MNTSRLGWYLRRIQRMSPTEVAWRARDTAFHELWKRRQVRPGAPIGPETRLPGPAITSTLPDGVSDLIAVDAAKALLAQADEILAGTLVLLGVERTDLAAPDWFFDPVTKRRAPSDTYAFNIAHRSEEVTGNIKQVWEISRLHHLTVLAAAWKLSGNDAYAAAVSDQLRSWWEQNPFLSGVNWTSGIEVGIRLISFVWIRRLLDGWTGIADLFENNPLAIAQIRWHQEYLGTFQSRGSSSNNHAIAEAAGQLTASCAFRWFDRSDRWRDQAAQLLQKELELNTFPSGMNRELASEYHWFVIELGIVSAVEADASGHPLSSATWDRLARMLDAGAAVLDSTLEHPRQGDGDDGKVLVTDPFEINRSAMLLSVGASVIGPAPWWPKVEPTVTSTLLGAMCDTRTRRPASTPRTRPSHFSDAGITVLRTPESVRPEIWCRCDGGPHGFLSIAGHAHADALSVEVRLEGTEILVDPGTYCYHGEPEFRDYFRSTVAHNTVEIASQDQSASGGPFMWLRHANTKGVAVEYTEEGATVRRWSAEHDGYESLDPPISHKRIVSLDADILQIDIRDVLTSGARASGVAIGGNHEARLMFHLGPSVSCRLENNVAELSWPSGSARMELPVQAEWAKHRGERSPLLGWYSPSFGVVEPTTVLMGRLPVEPGTTELHSQITFETATKEQPQPEDIVNK